MHSTHKTKFKQFKLLIFSIAILLFIQTPLTVHAEADYKAWAQSIVNSISSNLAGGTDTVHNGVKYTRTGYLCYLLTKDGADPGLPAFAYKSPGFSYLDGATNIITSRRGHTVPGFEDAIAPWGVTPWQEGGSPSNEPEIKAWFESMDSNAENGVQFVYDNWGEEAATHFTNDEYVLVIETLMHFQWSVPSGSEGTSIADIYTLVAGELSKISDSVLAYQAEYTYGYDGFFSRWLNTDNEQVKSNMMNSIRQSILLEVSNMKLDDITITGKYTTVGDPVIGTVPNLLDYKNSLGITGVVLDSYTNKVAPFSERIQYDEAGFVSYTGGTSSKVSDADVKSYGLAMLIIHAKSDMQTTCNEPSIPSPHEPPKESEGKVTIVKSYRTKDPTGALIDDGTYSLGDLGTQILIENEQVYQVIGWKTSTTTNTGISSLSWNPPSSVVQQGTTPKSVTLDPTETCLYVLLEKVEEEEVEEKEWNYRLSESSITRTVWFSNPDNPLTNMNSPWIYEHKFKWVSPKTPYCKGHGYLDYCQGNHVISCSEAGCTQKACELQPPHQHTDACPKACSTTHKKNCGSEDCPLESRIAYCSGTPEWVDKQLHLSINNTKQNDYPDILATKEGWNAESKKGDIIKRFYDNSPIERKSFNVEPHDKSSEIVNWDYVCILMRGKDKLTLAEWQNYGQGNNAGNNANDDLRDASSSGFTVANTDSGTRKITDYYETFNTHFNRDEIEGDVCTTGKFTVEPKDTDGDILAPVCQPEVKSYVNPLSVNNIVVKVETYSGTASEHKNDTTCHDGDLYYPLPGYNTSSGRMVKSGGIISFIPYIEMKYDTLEPPYDKSAYVLSEFTSQITPNDYAELSWNKTNDSNLSLISAQWSTHADACKDWGADNVLPGGATLSLNIKKDARQEVAVTTWQCILEGNGKTHVEKTGGSYGNLTRENAVSAHQAYVATVQAALESTNVQQYVEKNPNKSDAFGGLEVNPRVNISSLGTGAQTASTELKYYFRDDNTDSPSNEGDLDVNNLGTSQETYTFFACTHGHIHLSVGNTSPKISECNCGAYPIAKSDSIGQLINKRTLIIDKLEAALEQGTGSDGTIHSGPKWYNEAFDGITVIMQQTILEVGYNDPPERSSVLDPKLTPKQTSQKSLFSKYFLSQFKTKDHSTYYNEPYIMGEFKNAKVKLKDMDYLFHSRKFWIPNATTQDLH